MAQHSGCSKRSHNKAAGELKAEAYPLGYVEHFGELRTRLWAFFSILSQRRRRLLHMLIPTKKVNEGRSSTWIYRSARSCAGLGMNGRNAGSFGVMEIRSRSSANHPIVCRRKSVLPGKFTYPLLANEELPMTTTAGRGLPASGAFLGVRAKASGRGPWTSSLALKLTTRPFKSVSAQLRGDVRASGT
jgi:hypothetical protein